MLSAMPGLPFRGQKKFLPPRKIEALVRAAAVEAEGSGLVGKDRNL